MSETLSNIVRSEDRFATTVSLHVEVIADFVCPFCFLGKRRFDAALKSVKGPTEVHWYPFQLNPEMPAEGLPFDEYLTRRFGSPDNVAPALEHLADEGKAAGIDFRFDKISHVPNTLPVHQFMYMAESRQVDQLMLGEQLLSAFFEQGLNIGDQEVLVDIGETHGITADHVSEAIANDQARQIVLSREREVRGSGITGVPGFLLNRRFLVVGAQSADTLVKAFDRAMFGEGNDSLASPALH